MPLFQSLSTLRYQTLLMGCGVLLAGVIIAVGYWLIYGPGGRAADRLSSLQQVIPLAPVSQELLENPLRLDGGLLGQEVLAYRVQQGEQVEGVAYEVVAKGYSGDIVLMMGIAPNGTLHGVRVVSHSETPDFSHELELTESDWILSFNGRSLENPPRKDWAVKKDGGEFDQWTGATITPSAIVKAVKRGLEFFAANRSELLNTNSGASGGAHEEK